MSFALSVIYSSKVKSLFMENVTLIIVGGFLLLTLLVGLWAGRNVKTLQDYALPNRQFGSGVISMTVFATLVGGNSLFTTAARGFSYGFVMLLNTVGIMLPLQQF